jgi:hypothetical protein
VAVAAEVVVAMLVVMVGTARDHGRLQPAETAGRKKVSPIRTSCAIGNDVANTKQPRQKTSDASLKFSPSRMNTLSLNLSKYSPFSLTTQHHESFGL